MSATLSVGCRTHSRVLFPELRRTIDSPKYREAIDGSGGTQPYRIRYSVRDGKSGPGGRGFKVSLPVDVYPPQSKSHTVSDNSEMIAGTATNTKNKASLFA